MKVTRFCRWSIIVLYCGACSWQANNHQSLNTPLETEPTPPGILQAITVAQTATPVPVTTLIDRAKLHLEARQEALAEETFRQVLQRDNDHPQAMLGLGQMLLTQHRPVEALPYWQAAVKNNNIEPTIAWHGLGQTYLLQQNYPKAQHAFEQVLLHPPAPEAQWALATLLLPTDLEAGRALLLQIPSPSEQRDYLLEALAPFSTESDPAALAKTTGIALVQLEAWALAHHALEIATTADPTDPQSWGFLGHVQSSLGLPAETAFQTATELAPGLALTAYFVGLHERRQGNLDVALAQFLYALDLDPNNLGIAIEAAQTLVSKGDYLSAESWYQAIVKVEPEMPLYQQMLTEFYVNSSFRVAEAGLSEAEKLVSLKPADPVAHDLLGWAKFQTGDLGGAEVALRYAVQLDRTYLPAHYHLGRLLESLNQTEAAQVEFNYVITHDHAGQYPQLLQAFNSKTSK